MVFDNERRPSHAWIEALLSHYRSPLIYEIARANAPLIYEKARVNAERRPVLAHVATTDPIGFPVDAVCSPSDWHRVFNAGRSSVRAAVWHVRGS